MVNLCFLFRFDLGLRMVGFSLGFMRFSFSIEILLMNSLLKFLCDSKLSFVVEKINSINV